MPFTAMSPLVHVIENEAAVDFGVGDCTPFRTLVVWSRGNRSWNPYPDSYRIYVVVLNSFGVFLFEPFLVLTVRPVKAVVCLGRVDEPPDTVQAAKLKALWVLLRQQTMAP